MVPELTAFLALAPPVMLVRPSEAARSREAAFSKEREPRTSKVKAEQAACFATADLLAARAAR
jgi:hypothetical protein